jgi:hypothetical protein
LVRGYHRQQKREQERHEADGIDAWRRTRLLGTILVNINRAEKTPAITPEELFALPGDPPAPEPYVMSDEEFAETMARLAQYDEDIALANAAALEKAEAAKAAKQAITNTIV